MLFCDHDNIKTPCCPICGERLRTIDPVVELRAHMQTCLGRATTTAKKNEHTAKQKKLDATVARWVKWLKAFDNLANLANENELAMKKAAESVGI